MASDTDSAPDGLPIERLPFGQDFTPATLGKKLGEDALLRWLLTHADGQAKAQFTVEVGKECLGHVANDKDRRDMASHVFNAMRAYLLLDVEGTTIKLTPIGLALRAAAPGDVDLAFARHILTSCGGQRLLDAIRRYEVRGDVPDMEDLSIELGEHPTSKNISTLRAWLARAGVLSATGAYRVREDGVEAVLGKGVALLYGLRPVELEFLLAARVLEKQHGQPELDATVVAQLVDTRAPDVRVRRKALGSFVKRLEHAGLVRMLEQQAGKGGSRTSFALLERTASLTDEQLRGLLSQSNAGFSLADLEPLAVVIEQLDSGHAERLGRYGEMLAVHLCLMLGLSVSAWRKRAPHAEIDLIAERVAGLSYQRWAVQVKNTDGNLDSEQVDREIGAVAGVGITHVLFVVPRAGVTGPAAREMRTRSRLTGQHIYVLAKKEIGEKTAEAMLHHLRGQVRYHEFDKRAEARRREDW